MGDVGRYSGGVWQGVGALGASSVTPEVPALSLPGPAGMRAGYSLRVLCQASRFDTISENRCLRVRHLLYPAHAFPALSRSPIFPGGHSSAI